MSETEKFIISLCNDNKKQAYWDKPKDYPEKFQIICKSDQIGKGATLFIYHSFWDLVCIERFMFNRKTKAMQMVFDGIIDSGRANELLLFINRVFVRDVTEHEQVVSCTLKNHDSQQTFSFPGVIASLAMGKDPIYYRNQMLSCHHQLYNRYINCNFQLKLLSNSEHKKLHLALECGNKHEFTPYIQKSKIEQEKECINIFYASDSNRKCVLNQLKSWLLSGKFLRSNFMSELTIF